MTIVKFYTETGESVEFEIRPEDLENSLTDTDTIEAADLISSLERARRNAAEVVNQLAFDMDARIWLRQNRPTVLSTMFALLNVDNKTLAELAKEDGRRLVGGVRRSGTGGEPHVAQPGVRHDGVLLERCGRPHSCDGPGRRH